MAGIGFMDGGGDNGTAIESLHVLLDALLGPVRLGQRHIEEGFLSDLLVRARRVH